MSNHIKYVKQNRIVTKLSEIVSKSTESRLLYSRKDIIGLIKGFENEVVYGEEYFPEDIIYSTQWDTDDEKYREELQRIIPGAKYAIRVGDRVNIYGENFDNMLGFFPYDKSCVWKLMNGEVVYMESVKANTLTVATLKGRKTTFF